jgi:hypothetical protein
MIRLQIRLFGPYFSSFSAHGTNYEPSKELNSALKHPDFRFGQFSPTGSWAAGFGKNNTVEFDFPLKECQS